MKTISTILLAALALGAGYVAVAAQEPAKDGGPGDGRGRRPMPPVMAALDTTKDGELDATEIANATAALKTLDKNADGKLSGDEIRPARGERGPGGDRRGGPRGEGRGPDGAAPKP